MTDPRIRDYETRYECRFKGMLGAGPGQDGFVMRSDRFTAVKFFDRLDRFEREHEVYQVMSARGICFIAEHYVPLFVRADESLRAIEMTIVERPFILDFAGAKRPEEIPDSEPHVLEEHAEHLRELFDDRYADAVHVAEMFRRTTGFTLLDIHPGNIAFDE